jgi:hypothetical protein
MKKPNTPAAMMKVDEALRAIQEAQNRMGTAAQHLSSLRFGAPKYKKALKLYEKIHAFWYELERFASVPQSLSHDREPEP